MSRKFFKINYKDSSSTFMDCDILNYSFVTGDEDFPRQQLHYLRECGQGWFGKVSVIIILYNYSPLYSTFKLN